MKSRNERHRNSFRFETLEGRVALSGGIGFDDNLPKHSGRDAAEVRRVDDNLPKHSGQDEAAGHDVGDDNLPRHSGKDETANHDAGDDNLPKHSGKDDGSGHR